MYALFSQPLIQLCCWFILTAGLFRMFSRILVVIDKIPVRDNQEFCAWVNPTKFGRQNITMKVSLPVQEIYYE